MAKQNVSISSTHRKPKFKPAFQITAGDNHSAVLSKDGRVYIWGSFRDNNGLIGMLKPFEKLAAPTLVPLGHKIIKIASGENHFAMLTEQGAILTFGCAEQGQLGRISPNNLVRGGRKGLLPLLTPDIVRVRHSVRFDDLWAGAFCTVGKTQDGVVYGCGLNNYRQLATPDELMQVMMANLDGFNALGESWRSFSFGQHHTVALSASQHAFVIGRGEYGSLGLGDNEHRVEVTRVPLPHDAVGKIRSVAACNRTSYALMDDGTVFSWGMGSSYQLGHGDDDDDVNVPTRMLGKQLGGKRVVEISPGFQHVLMRVVPDDGLDNHVPVEKKDVPVEKEDVPVEKNDVQVQEGEKSNEEMEVEQEKVPEMEEAEENVEEVKKTMEMSVEEEAKEAIVAEVNEIIQAETEVAVETEVKEAIVKETKEAIEAAAAPVAVMGNGHEGGEQMEVEDGPH